MAKAANGNGIFWKILMWAAGALIAIGVAWATLGNNITNNKMRIDKIEPQVQKNSEYRIVAENDTKWLKEKVANIEMMQRQLLDEIRKQ